MVVIHHKNIHELASLRFRKLNLECQKIKMGRKYMNTYHFSLRDYILNHHHAVGYRSCFYSCSLFLKSSYYNSYTWPKTVHLQLSEVIFSDMYNCNFEIINQENEKIRNGIWIIHLHNHLLSDTLFKIQERVSCAKFTLRTPYICW